MKRTIVALDFQDSIFSGNGTDVDNPGDQPVDLSQAIFS